MRLFVRTALATAAMAALLGVGCGGRGNDPARPASEMRPEARQSAGSTRLIFFWPDRGRLIPVESNSITIQLLKGGAALPGTDRLVVRPATGGGTQETVTWDDLPLGPLTVTATAYPNADGTGTAQAAASMEVDIQNGANNPPPLTMASTIARVTMTVQGVADNTVPIGKSVTVIATPLDARRRIVLTRKDRWTWASGDPALATITAADGPQATVTLNAAGSAEVRAQETESQATGRSSITARTGIPRYYSITRLPGLSPTSSVFYKGINDKGQAVGTDLGTPNTALVWENGVVTNLGAQLGSNEGSGASVINNAGQIAGTTRHPSTPAYTPTTRAFVWQNGVMTDLGILPGGAGIFPDDINDNGQIVGISGFYDGTTGGGRAFLWQNGVLQSLGVLPKRDTIRSQDSAAYAINNAGQVVGDSRVSQEESRAFLWQNGTMTDLGILPNFDGKWYRARSINNSGQIVGMANNVVLDGRAFL